MALLYHPDKVGNSPEAIQTFQDILKAYQCLSDVQNRRIYDRFGENGVKFKQYVPFMDPELMLKLEWVFFVVSFILSLLIMFPAFISVRGTRATYSVDGRVDWAWLIVFIPAFIVDAFVIVLFFKYASVDEVVDSENDAENENQEFLAQGKSVKRNWFNYIWKLSLLLNLIIFQVLIAARLDLVIACSWALVFIPWWILEAISLILGFYLLKLTLAHGIPITPEMDETDTEIHHTRKHTILEILNEIFSIFGFQSFRVSQLILICLKLEGIVTFAWTIVFIDTYISGFLSLLDLLYSTRQYKRNLSSGGPKSETHYYYLVSRWILFIVTSILFYTFIGLLIKRLDSIDANPSTALILVPFFIVLSILFCCFCCCLPCTLWIGMLALEEESEMKILYERLSRNSKRITWRVDIEQP